MKKETITVQTKLIPLSATLVLMVCLALSIPPTAATLEHVERSTKTTGATKISWDSSFQDLEYTKGTDISLKVTWTVEAGAAEYNSFTFKRATPKSKKDPALVELIGITYEDDTSVVVTFKFTELHWDAERQVDIGNAHFKLYLMVDENGDGNVETLAAYGVNVHVEDPT